MFRQIPVEMRQTPDPHIQCEGGIHSGETTGAQSAPSNGWKIPVDISDTKYRQLAEAISVGLDRDLQNLAIISRSTEPDLAYDETQLLNFRYPIVRFI